VSPSYARDGAIAAAGVSRAPRAASDLKGLRAAGHQGLSFHAGERPPEDRDIHRISGVPAWAPDIAVGFRITPEEGIDRHRATR